MSEEFKNTPEILELTKKHDQIKKQHRLFSKCTFIINREVPTYCLQYLIMSFGGTFYTQDGVQGTKKVTHHVIDRPLGKEQKGKGDVELVQP